MKKVWLITGVSSGFGYEMTKQLLKNGDTVVGTVRNTKKVKDFIERFPNTFDCKILDVTDMKAVEQTVRDSFEKHGKIDVVVSNAGYGLFGCVEELSDEEIDHIIATNLVGSIALLKIAVPYMSRAAADLSRCRHTAVRSLMRQTPCTTLQNSALRAFANRLRRKSHNSTSVLQLLNRAEQEQNSVTAAPRSQSSCQNMRAVTAF